MDAKKLLEKVKTATEEQMDYYAFAAYLIEQQKQEDAAIAESFSRFDIAAAIRA